MAISNKSGHGVTNMAGNHNMEARPAQPNFMPTQGPANYNGGSGSGSFPAANKGKGKVAQSPGQQTPPNAMLAGSGGQQ